MAARNKCRSKNQRACACRQTMPYEAKPRRLLSQPGREPLADAIATLQLTGTLPRVARLDMALAAVAWTERKKGSDRGLPGYHHGSTRGSPGRRCPSGWSSEFHKGRWTRDIEDNEATNNKTLGCPATNPPGTRTALPRRSPIFGTGQPTAASNQARMRGPACNAPERSVPPQVA